MAWRALRGLVLEPRMTNEDALDLLSVVLPGGRGYFALITHDSRRETIWLDVKDRARFRRMVPSLAWDRDVELRVCPLADEGSFRVDGLAGCVWARVENGASARRLAEFRPLPTLVLRDGATVARTAFWAVRKPLRPDDAEKVSRHLAHKLGSPKKYAACSFLFRPPGSVVRHGRSRPLPIVVAGGSGEPYPVGAVCRSLPRTVPDPEAWREFASSKHRPRAPGQATLL